MSWLGIERGPVTTREELIQGILAIIGHHEFYNKGTIWLEAELNKLLDEYDEDFYCRDYTDGWGKKCDNQCKDCKI